MALQSSGAISLNNVNVELGNSGTASINMGSAAVRDLFGVASGAISLSDGYGASNGYDISYLVIAGGAGGGGHYYGGGGGAGGYLNSYASESSGANSTSLTSITTGSGTVYTVTVGCGGTTGVALWSLGGDGSTSSISGSGLTTISATGGGGGGGGGGIAIVAGRAGGSGGGNSSYLTTGSAGAGTSLQGYAGNVGNTLAGGGGGGAGQLGNTGGVLGGVGGYGLASSITGTSTYRAGGGTGSNFDNHDFTSPGGLGGGGVGGRGGTLDLCPGNGVTNTGGGGGGRLGIWTCSGAAGGSGVVILRMPTSNYSGTTTGSPTVTTTGSDTVITFTGSGSYTA